MARESKRWWTAGDCRRSGRALFVVFQRREGDLRVPRISAVDVLSVVDEGELGEAFGIAGGLGPLCPRLAVAVRACSSDTGAAAMLAEFVGAVGS